MKIGDSVSWLTMFNRLMFGEIVAIQEDKYDIRRSDGGICTLPKSWVDSEQFESARPFTYNEGGNSASS